MRKIEKKMLQAIEEKKFWNESNTCVDYVNAGNPFGDRAEIYLHGNHIADYWYESKKLGVDVVTLAKWPSNTTKSRLRALGANIYTKKFEVYLDNQKI